VEETCARATLARANGSLHEASERRDLAWRCYARSAVGDAIPSTMAELCCERSRAALLADVARCEEEAVAAASGEVSAARHAWSDAARSVALLERLEARRRQDHAAEANRQEAARSDDLVTARRLGALAAGFDGCGDGS
jgi:hypothetical protein